MCEVSTQSEPTSASYPWTSHFRYCVVEHRLHDPWIVRAAVSTSEPRLSGQNSDCLCSLGEFVLTTAGPGTHSYAAIPAHRNTRRSQLLTSVPGALTVVPLSQARGPTPFASISRCDRGYWHVTGHYFVPDVRDTYTDSPFHKTTSDYTSRVYEPSRSKLRLQ